VFFTLYRCDRRPRARWTRLIHQRLGYAQLRARGQGLVDDVFEQLAAQYVLDALYGRIPPSMSIGAWLHRRFSWDSYRAAERIIRNAGALAAASEHGADAPEEQRLPALGGDAFDMTAFELLEDRVGAIVASLPELERRAVTARMLCGMSAEHAYELLQLPKDSRTRANHNQAFAVGMGKVRRTLRREGWIGSAAVSP